MRPDAYTSATLMLHALGEGVRYTAQARELTMGGREDGKRRL